MPACIMQIENYKMVDVCYKFSATRDAYVPKTPPSGWIIITIFFVSYFDTFLEKGWWWHYWPTRAIKENGCCLKKNVFHDIWAAV